ncbi:hypothetical protein BGX38DRAFT_1207136 [Terfezia claveryi]|nr:hypothetical protein BGX38DRAFT_1207136 [Terfezia claveryi]
MSSPPTSFKLNASVGLEDTRNNPPVEDYDDASCFPELHLANYVQNLHHNVPQYNFSESIYHGISRGPLSDRMRIDLCSSLAMLMDTGTGPETATAVSISICGGTGTQGYQLPREELAREISSKNMKCDTGLCHVRVKVYVAQGRDEVPKVDLQNLHKVLVEVGFFHEFFDAPQVSQESQDKEIMRDILPAIVRLSEQKIMLILNQLPLLDRAYAEMIHKCHPENYTIPTTVQAKYKSIHDLASEAMRPGCNAEKRHYILGHIIRHSYELRSSIDNEIGVLDAMERNWAGIIRFQLKTGVLPTTTEVIPAKYRGETFGGWRSQDPERDLEMDENDNLSSHSEGTEPENPSCDYDKYSLPQKLVKQYVAHNGIYSRLCPRFRDGQPLNPLTYWLGALGKYFVAAKILLHSPVFYRVASRPRNSKVDILVRGVPYNLFARYSQTASGRPDVPRTFDQFARYQIDTGVAPKIGYGSSNVRNSFEMHWQDAVKNQHLFVHPEMKLILYNAIEWRFNRQLVYIRREDTELTGEKVIRDLDSLDRCKHYRVIGTSRDICFSCRAFIKGWNGVNDKQQVLPDGRKRTPQCHCTNMVLGYRCNYCEDFDEEPLRTHLRFFVGFAGDPNIQTQRNHFFDPSWLAPRIMMPIGFEEGNHQFWHQLEVFLETLNHRNQVCVRIELQKLLGEGRIQELLECAAENGFGNEEGSEFDPLTHKVNQVTDVFLVPHRALQNQGPKAMVPAHEVPAESQTRVQRPVNLVAQNCPLIEVAEQVQFVNTIPTEAQEHYSADELYQYPRR